MMWKSSLIVVIVLIISCGATDYRGNYASKKFTIEELLSMSFPYTDPRTDSQLDMDPCKSGKKIKPSYICSRSYIVPS